MFVVVKAKADNFNKLYRQGIFINKKKKFNRIDQSSYYSYDKLSQLSNNIYYTMDTETRSLIAFIAGRHETPEEISNRGPDCLQSYIIELANIDDSLTTYYENQSLTNMARILLRTFLADKDGYQIYLYTDGEGITMSSFLKDALIFNDFKLHNEDGREVYIRSASSIKFKQYYN